MKLLTVDDSAVVRKIIRAAAEVLEFEILEAEDGKEALTILENLESEMDLILLDWNMPGMNGLELLKEIKKIKKYRNVPIMMVTTESKRDNIVEAIKAGAAHYMTKPFTMEDLMKRMLECLGRGTL